MKQSPDTKPANAGSWFVLCVEPNPIILDASEVASACESFDGDLIAALQSEGYVPFTDDEGNWIAWSLRPDVFPCTAPSSMEHVAKFIAPGTVVTLDNGCYPSLEWRFDGSRVDVFDTFDYSADDEG